MGTSLHQSHCRVCEAAARRGHALPPCWPPAPVAEPRATRRWPSGCPRPHCGSGTSGPARWCSAGCHLKDRGRRGRSSFWCCVFRMRLNLGIAVVVSPRLIRPSLDKQPCGWTLVTKIGSSPLLLPRPPATVMPRDSRGSFFTVMCFSLQVTHWERSWV